MATPVLATKLFAPARRRQLVARPRLVEKLADTLAPGHRLTLISAPAGFGKTTVLGDFLLHLEERRAGTRVAWVSLDDGDNDLARLVNHVIAALRGAKVTVDTVNLDSLQAVSIPAALTAIVNDVSRTGELTPGGNWVLVFDDYHVITSFDVHEAVAFLLDHLPDCLHLMLATRADPPLPLTRLRSRGQLTELRAADLRFTASEAGKFLTQMMGLDLSAADVDALEERTEGWIAGLQLAALSLRSVAGRSETLDFIQQFTGSNRFVIDYLVDEVLARQGADVREFLLGTAILDRLTGPLCDAVTGRPGGDRSLEDLERGNLFLVPLDDRRCWYRYHHLFADVLRARLLAEQPDRVPDLHLRASAWYDSQGMAVDAVRHALAGSDFHRASRLMEQALPELRRARQDAVLLAWIRALPDSVIRCSPVLCVMSGWSLMMSGDLAGLEQRLDDAQEAVDAAEADPDLAAALPPTEEMRTAPATIAVYRASLAQARGDVAGTVRHAARAIGLAGPDDHFVRGAAGGFLGLAAWAAGDVGQALSTFGDAVRSLHAAGNLVDELDSVVVLADMWVASGRPSRARHLFERALRTATSRGEPYPRATADMHVGLAELDRELDDLDSARTHLDVARALRERAFITENRHRWYLAMAQVSAAAGDHNGAAHLLDEAEAAYRRGFYPDVRPIAAIRARLDVARDDLDAAGAWHRDSGVGTDDEAEYLREYEHLTLVRLLLGQFRSAGHGGRSSGAPAAAAVLGLLDRLHGKAVEAGREGSVLEIRLLSALAQHARGDLTRAVDTLQRAHAGAPEPAAWVRLYLDEGAPMRALLEQATAGRAVPGDDREWMRVLLRRATGSADVEGSQPLVDALSRREVEVLRLLQGELTGPQIARHLYISLNTLRSHTKSIFAKLDVSTRAAAVRRARERGLL